MKQQLFPSGNGHVTHRDQRRHAGSITVHVARCLQRGVFVVLCAAAIAACAAPPETDAISVSPEKMLSALVGLATNEDLVDHERVAKLLNLRLVMKADSQERFTEDGRLIRRVTAEKPIDPGYFPVQGGGLNYRVVTEPARSANFSIGFDRFKLCMNIDDVRAQFSKHGVLRQSPPPLPHAPPPGEIRRELPEEQPVYGYQFKGSRKIAVLDFGYTKCLLAFSTFQN